MDSFKGKQIHKKVQVSSINQDCENENKINEDMILADKPIKVLFRQYIWQQYSWFGFADGQIYNELIQTRNTKTYL